MLGVVADDLTGALDAALLIHAEGVRAPVVVGIDALLRLPTPPPTVILDVDSRGDPPEVAYSKVRKATRTLMNAGYTRFYKKISSTFQGHIGQELDAVMDETGVDIAIVVPAFPANKRTVKDGHLYVKGVPVSETGVGRHPTSPIADSYLPGVLQKQTRRPVALVDIKKVREGTSMFGIELIRLLGSRQAGVALVDAATDHDLKIIAKAAQQLEVCAGASALAGKLVRQEHLLSLMALEAPEAVLSGCLLLVGSVSPVTAGQVSHALRSGLAGLRLDVLALLDPAAREAEVERAVGFALERLGKGGDAMVYTPSDLQDQAQTRKRGKELGIDPMGVGMAIAEGQAEVAARVVEKTGLNRLIVAGGDTSSAVCRRLGLEQHVVLGEIQTGVPLSVSMGDRTLLTVLKSGNFGTKGFFARALERVRG